MEAIALEWKEVGSKVGEVSMVSRRPTHAPPVAEGLD
jgi:hypothetical protein